MEITPKQYKKIKNSLPVQRGNVHLSNVTMLNALLYVAENDCKWRALAGMCDKKIRILNSLAQHSRMTH